MSTVNIRCGYLGCSNPAEPRLIQSILGIGEVKLLVEMCDPHYDLHEIDDDVIDWLKEEWSKQT